MPSTATIAPHGRHHVVAKAIAGRRAGLGQMRSCAEVGSCMRRVVGKVDVAALRLHRPRRRHGSFYEPGEVSETAIATLESSAPGEGGYRPDRRTASIATSATKVTGTLVDATLSGAARRPRRRHARALKRAEASHPSLSGFSCRSTRYTRAAPEAPWPHWYADRILEHFATR
jgi:hypothetical protein